jgi:hypothetical protein
LSMYKESGYQLSITVRDAIKHQPNDRFAQGLD